MGGPGREDYLNMKRAILKVLLCIFVCGSLRALASASEPWPQFRGPDGQGQAAAKDLPVTWSESEHVKWKTELPGEAWSSPVISDNQIWMTNATDAGQSLRAICVTLDTGKLIQDVEVFHIEKPETKHALNSYASATPIIDDGRLYVYFGTHGAACLSAKDGKKIWENRDLKHDTQNGEGSTPISYKDKLLICVDGMDVQYQLALNKSDGSVAWKTKRSMPVLKKEDLRKAYGTPLVYKFDGKDQMVATAAEGFYAYDPETGKELWRLKHPGFSNVPVPVYGNGMLYMSTGFTKAQMWAVKPIAGGGEKPDLPAENVVWRINGQAPCPTQPSPLVIGERLYMLSDTGALSCLNALTGGVVWTVKLGGEYSGSPSYADGKIYLFNRMGKAIVFEPGDTFKKLAENTLEEGAMASPAFIDKALILRTKKALYRIEK
jgi:outer membrane protein assembly factor BamB